jgi:hypothetical protein
MVRYQRRIALLARVLSFALCVAVTAAAGAQALPDDARGARARAERCLERPPALRQHFPDQPEWREALDLGRDAARLAPEHPAPQRFLAQAYGTVQWNSRAWDAWQAYLELGGSIDAQAATRLVSVARSLGVAHLRRRPSSGRPAVPRDRPPLRTRRPRRQHATGPLARGTRRVRARAPVRRGPRRRRRRLTTRSWTTCAGDDRSLRGGGGRLQRGSHRPGRRPVRTRRLASYRAPSPRRRRSPRRGARSAT